MKIQNEIKRIIVALAPYSFVKKRMYLRSSREVPSLDTSIPSLSPEISKFKAIISVQGIGFSGSGAVNDYLREFSDCIFFGSEEGKGFNGEVDFLRHAGGLYEIEKYIDSNNLFQKDALIKRFKLLTITTYLFKSSKAKLLLKQFYNSIVDYEINTRGHHDYNGYLKSSFYNDCNIQVMKRMTKVEYRTLCRFFIASLFNEYYKEGLDFIILDQMCCDFDYNHKRDMEYVPNLKTIVVIRDPRDIYVYAKLFDVPWIEHDNVDFYIRWYRNMIDKIDMNSNDYLPIKFEELVLNYDEVTSRINSYIGLDERFHVRRKEFLNPDVSKKNVGIWKLSPQYNKDFDIIKSELVEYCYCA